MTTSEQYANGGLIEGPPDATLPMFLAKSAGCSMITAEQARRFGLGSGLLARLNAGMITAEEIPAP